MRYDKIVYFAVEGKRIYDPATGDYKDAQPILAEKDAAVMDTQEETMQMVYGAIRQGSLTIHLQNHYDDPFDYIQYEGRKYRVDYSRRLRVKHTFVVSEVM